MNLRLLSVLLGSVAVTACSSSSSPSPGAAPSMDGMDAAAPSGNDAAPVMSEDAGVPLAAPPMGQGLQYEMQTTIPAGLEDERCRFVVAPPEGLWIHDEDVRYTPGSHHFILWMTSYKTVPTKNDNGGTPVDPSGKTVVPSSGDVFECSNGPNAEWSATNLVGGSQSSDAPTVIKNLPDGIAVHVPGNAVLMMDLHVLNATSAAVPTDVRINLYTVDGSTVKTEAGMYLFYNPFIVVPPHASAHARMSCPVTSDITLVNTQSHMHARGLGGVAKLMDSSGTMLQQFYESHDWVNVPVETFPSGMPLKKGQGIDYECNYQSQQDDTVYQGLKTTDEMCVLAGVYYPKDAAFETCSAEGLFNDNSDDATYIGTGTATCEASLLCVAQAGNGLQGLTPCITASCPKAGVPLTGVLRCEEGAIGGQCGSACSGGGSGCLSCVETACGKQISACTSAACN